MFSLKNIFFEKNLPQAAKLPGTNGFFKKYSFCQKSALGNFAARDKWLLQKSRFLEKVLPQAAKLPGTSGFFKKKSIFWNKFCPRQRSCPEQVASSIKKQLSANSSAPGSEAAQDKWLLQKSRFLKKVLAQAAKLPGTSGFFKKMIFWKQFCPRQRSCPGQEASSKK